MIHFYRYNQDVSFLLSILEVFRNKFMKFLLFFFQVDDKSLLARFYHADRGLTAVANELDSFDGRSEPERCSRLVSKLRQEQVNFLNFQLLFLN